MSTFFIGVDGGGTKTKAVLIDELGNMVGSAIGGSTNIQAVGGESLQKEMFSILNRLIGNAKKDAGDIRYIVMGLAGAGRVSDRKHIGAFFETSEYGGKVVVESDAVIALAGAFANQPGIILIAGTGSICFGKGADGEIVRAGGWGYLLGDEGSGYAMGRDGIVAALKDLDGRGMTTSLRGILEKRYDLDSIDEIIPLIYSGEIDRKSIAEFAIDVFDQANKGDEKAKAIVASTGLELGLLVKAVSERLSLSGAMVRVASIGSLFLQRSMLLPGILQGMGSGENALEIIDPMFSPQVGAALLAMVSAGIEIDDQLLERLRSSIKGE